MHHRHLYIWPLMEAEAPLYTLVYDIAVDSELQVAIVATTFTEGAIE